MGVAVIVGASLSSILSFSSNLILGCITSFTLTGASMAINDYYDLEIDRINEPKRPIPSGAVSPKEAVTFALVLSLVGFIAALRTNLVCFIVSIIAWILFVTYTTKGKQTGLPGNLLVSACVVTPLIYGSLVMGNPPNRLTMIYIVMAFLSNTGREIAKGIVDVEGDRSRHVKTIAVLYGERNAAAVSAVLVFLAVGVTAFPWLLHLTSLWFVPLIVVTDVGLMLSCLSLLRDYSRKNARRVKTSFLVWFTTGLMAFLAGTVS
jgi:geranylgeranylglycerol-phosphate geranylgeranyltransferase